MLESTNFSLVKNKEEASHFEQFSSDAAQGNKMSIKRFFLKKKYRPKDNS
jgi:hypothetical protein